MEICRNILILFFALISANVIGEKTTHPQTFTYPDTPSGFNEERLSRIDSAYIRLIENGLIPHAATLVIHKGEVVHYKAFGWRDIENRIPCERTDIFRIASQSKAITVVALMTLWEEGLFQLDEPVKKYIPEFANPKVLEKYDNSTGSYTSKPAKRDITIRDLMTHTSGISYNGVHRRIKDAAKVPILMSKEPYKLGDVVKRLAKLPLAHDPGEEFTYSMNIEVLGYLAEILSGKPLDLFLKEKIFEPLGMTDTYFYIPDAKKERLVTLYTYPQNGSLRKSADPLFTDYPIVGAKTYFSPGAGLCGTIIDYAKFCQMILNDGEFNDNRILGRKTVEMMKRNNVGDLRGEIGFGLAWDVFRPEYIHKSIASEGSSRWGGMFGTDYLIDYQEELIVIMYVNWVPNGTGTDTKQLMHNLTYQAME